MKSPRCTSPHPKPIKSYRDLRVWRSAMDLVEDIYRVTKDFPKEELYGLTSQMRRAAVSIPSNIAEGKMRAHLREYLHFLTVAQGSLGELDTQVEIAQRLDYLSAERSRGLQGQISRIAKQIWALRKGLSGSGV